MSDKIIKNRTKSQQISITSELIKEAAAAQLKSQAADNGLENGRRGTKATPQQMMGTRRRMDDILIDMLLDWSKSRPENRRVVEISAKPKTHRGRRSQESVKRRAGRE